jgi:hypothetical protein
LALTNEVDICTSLQIPASARIPYPLPINNIACLIVRLRRIPLPSSPQHAFLDTSRVSVCGSLGHDQQPLAARKASLLQFLSYPLTIPRLPRDLLPSPYHAVAIMFALNPDTPNNDTPGFLTLPPPPPRTHVISSMPPLDHYNAANWHAHFIHTTQSVGPARPDVASFDIELGDNAAGYIWVAANGTTDLY